MRWLNIFTVAGREIYYHSNPKNYKQLINGWHSLGAMWEDKYSQLDIVLKHLKNKKS